MEEETVTLSEIKQTQHALGHAFEEFKKTNDARLDQFARKGAVDPLITEKMEKLEQSISDAQSSLEAMERKLNRPKAGGAEGADDQSAVEHKNAFMDWMRNPRDHQKAIRLKETSLGVIREKAVDTAAPGTGGHAVPEQISRTISRKLLDLSPVRNVIDIQQASTPDFKVLVDVRGTSAGWVGSGDTRTETDTSSLEEVAPTFGTLYAYPKATEEALQDMFFNVENWLTTSVADIFAKEEGKAFISGNGTKKPTGFLNGTPVTVGDEDTSPARTFGVLQYFPTGAATDFLALDVASGEFPGDVLYDVVYALKAGYRANARWMMNKATLGKIRKLKDADGNYLWAPGIQVGQPSALLGYGVAEAEDMPGMAANTFPIAFGDFRAGYIGVDLAGMSITVDPITTPGYVKFYVRRRLGGKLKNDDAIKLIKVATT